MTADKREGQSSQGRRTDASCADSTVNTNAVAEAEQLRATERERLRALVTADLDAAERLHAADFQLINPAGVVLSREQYLGWIASGEIDYRVWEPVSPIDVRLFDGAAVLRYQARLEMIRGGRHWGPSLCWHTDTYERRNGQWQVVWSQATEIQ